MGVQNLIIPLLYMHGKLATQRVDFRKYSTLNLFLLHSENRTSVKVHGFISGKILGNLP